ncbi:MAG: serine/threonine protein kinase, partial [Proteobacteria bacterium]|nr:serine/threonine protein kinase [Pseudomonadota bacterium]
MTKVNSNQQNTTNPPVEDDKTVSLSRYDTAELDNEETMALMDDACTVALTRDPEKFSEVKMDTDKPRVQRGLDDLEGEVISGRYRITRRIGKGGMGVVYLAAQTNLDRNVCIKVLNPALLDDADAVGRFEREARGLSRLQHPNIVTIFDYGRDGNLAYIVMKYAQGETLGKYLKAHGPLKLDDFLPIAVQVLKGIGEAHKLGLIHRDIKPANIVLCELEGEKNFVKILDFGLAKLAQGGEDLTKDQQLVGSASYMSPEQILTGASDTRTDVYALGVMFFLMLSGHKPFTGSNDNAILYQHVNAAPPPLEPLLSPEQNVPPELCQVIAQCLMKSPDKRPQTALDLLTAISYALDAPQLRAGYSSMTLQRV